jgi:mannosyltransferase
VTAERLHATRAPDIHVNFTRGVALLSILVAWLLGFWQLGNQSMWVDEWYTNLNIGQSWADLLPSLIATERRPPLYYVSLKLWSSAAGGEETAFRLYSLGMVTLAVALIYALGRRLFAAHSAALAALLLAASPFWLLYGRMIRSYSQTMMLALAGTLLLVEAMRRGPGWWAAYTLAAAALIYTDYSGLPILAAHGVYVASAGIASTPRTWQSLRGWLLAMVAVALLYVPWLPAILIATDRSVRITDLAGGPLGFAVKLGMPLYSWGTGETIYPWNPLGAAAALAMGLAALWGWWMTWRAARATAWLLAAWLALPLLFTATLLSLVATDITFLNAASRTPGAAPAYVLAAAAGLVALRRRWLQAVALACIAAGVVAATLNYFGGVQYLNPIYALPARALAADLAAQAQPGDLILAEPDTLLGHYYNLHPGAATYQDVDPATNLEWIEQHSPATVWLVTYGRDSTEGAFGADEVRAQLEATYAPGATYGYGRVEPAYQTVKQRLTGRPPYAHKLTIQPFSR